MRFIGRSLIGLFLLSITVGLLAFAGITVQGALQERAERESRQRPAREQVFAVNVVLAEPQSISPELRVFGEVQASRVLELRAPVSGQVVDLASGFSEGGLVKAGQLLLRIDPAQAEAGLATARNNMAQAEADFRDAERQLSLAMEELAAAEGQVELRAQAQARQRDLLDRGVGSAAAVETADLALANARQSVVSRKQAIANAEARVDTVTNSLARLQIDLAEAERALSETRLYADFDGTLSDVSVTLGGLVGQNEQLAALIDPDDLEVAIRLSTAQHARLLNDKGRLRDAAATVTLDVLGVDVSTKASLTREAPAVGEGQTGRLVFASLEKSTGFRPGDFVEIAIEEPALNFAVRLPSTALSAQNAVLILGEEDRLEEVSVNLLRRQGDDVIVRSRDIAGREVVAERTPLLGAGIKVRPLRPDDANQAPAAPEMIALDPERRERLVAFIESNGRMPAEVKQRMLGRLEQEKVPAAMVERIESRMGS